MSAIEFHRAAIAFHQAEIDKLTGVPPPSGFDQLDFRTWWPAMIEQARNARLPHAWIDIAPGTGGYQGDNDPEPPWLRVFSTFTDAATRDGFTDSAGERFAIPNLKKRAGLGGWDDVLVEVRRAWDSDWGISWRTNEANLREGKVPKVAP